MARPVTICLSLLAYLWFSQLHAKTAYLQPDLVYSGDIAELVIEYDSKIPSLYALDTSVLEADFEVLDVHSSVSRVFESNDSFHRMQWRIPILPRRNGFLQVPPLRVGETSTKSLTLEVREQTAAMISTSRVWVELEAEPENPYTGQHTHIIVRVFHNAPLSDGNLSDPVSGDLDMRRNGIDSRYRVQRNGELYEVLERKLVLVAGSPGEARIAPAVYRGTIEPMKLDSGALTEARRIFRNSEALVLQVRQPPPSFSGRIWLPARHLELRQQWDDLNTPLKVGASFGVTLSVEARGVAAEALPANLLTADSDRFRIYPDHEVRSNRFDGLELVGKLDQRYAVIVSKAGTINLPAVSLKWWNLDRDAAEIARLEGRSLKVETPFTDSLGQVGSLMRLPPDAATWISTMRGHWPWILLAFSILLVLATAVFYRPLRNRIQTGVEARLADARNRKLLKRACESNDPAAARKALLEWGRTRWPETRVTGLYQLEYLMQSSELTAEINRLDAILYAQKSLPWQGRRLWQVFATGLRRAEYRPLPDETSLPELYPRKI